jgi:hypothetical protein
MASAVVMGWFLFVLIFHPVGDAMAYSDWKR